MQRATRHSHWAFLAAFGVAGLGLSGCAATSAERRGAEWTGSRAVVMHQPDTGERVSVVYGRNGVYDRQALDQVAYLMRDRRTGEVSPIDPELLNILVTVRENLGLGPSAVFKVTSGYRSPLTNAALARRSPNVAENSYHLRGKAVDFHIDGVSPERIAELAGQLGLGGYAWYPHTGHVHLDTGPVRTWTPRAPRRGGGWIEVRSTTRQSASAVAMLPSPKPGAAAKLKPTAKAVAGKPGAAKPTAAKAAPGRPASSKPASNRPAAKPAALKIAGKPGAKPAAARR